MRVIFNAVLLFFVLATRASGQDVLGANELAAIRDAIRQHAGDRLGASIAEKVLFSPEDLLLDAEGVLHWKVTARLPLGEGERSRIEEQLKSFLKESAGDAFTGDLQAAFNRAVENIYLEIPDRPAEVPPPVTQQPEPPLAGAYRPQPQLAPAPSAIEPSWEPGWCFCRPARRCGFRRQAFIACRVYANQESCGSAMAPINTFAQDAAPRQMLAQQICEIVKSLQLAFVSIEIPSQSAEHGAKVAARPATDVTIADEQYGQGYHAYWQGDYARALRALQAALEADRNDARVWYYKGLAELATGDQRGSVESFAHAVTLEGTGNANRRLVHAALERVQGKLRIELENAKRQAMLLPPPKPAVLAAESSNR